MVKYNALNQRFRNYETELYPVLLRSIRIACISIFLICLTVVASSNAVQAQVQTVGLFVNDSSAYEGYTLFAPLRSSTTYLIDMKGRLINSWDVGSSPNNSVYLLENGNLLRPSKATETSVRKIQEIGWDGTVVWEFEYDNDDHYQHHDIEPLPNGNVLILAFETFSKAEAIAAGRDSLLLSDTTLMPEHVIEVEPTGSYGGNIVWEWHLWDHLIQEHDATKDNYGVVADHSELVNINQVLRTKPDWIHGNGLAYNPDLDQIMISSRSFSEFWVIDHSTTSAEATTHSGGNSGMGGDLIYRWGNPITYGGGTAEDQTLFVQHNAHWISSGLPGEGNILVFNNGGTRAFSSVDEIIPPVDVTGDYPQPAAGTSHGPTAAHWSYGNDTDEYFYSSKISGVQRLPNGNTLVCSGYEGTFFEVSPDREIVWRYVNPVSSGSPIDQCTTPSPSTNTVFRCTRYATDYPGLVGRDLTPGQVLERYSIQITGTTHSPADPIASVAISITANIIADSGFVSLDVYVDTGDGYVTVPMADDGSHNDGASGDGLFGAVLPPMPEGTVIQYYIYVVDSAGQYSADPTYPQLSTYTAIVGPGLCCVGNRGDINGDGNDLDIVDLTCVVDYLFGGWCSMQCSEEADVNGDGTAADIVDLTFIVDWLFGEAPTPVACP